MKQFTKHPKVCNFIQFNLLSIWISNQKAVITRTRQRVINKDRANLPAVFHIYKTTCCIVFQKPQDTAMSKFNFTQLMKSVPFQLENVSRRKSTAQQYTRYQTQTTDNTIRAENLIHLIWKMTQKSFLKVEPLSLIQDVIFLVNAHKNSYKSYLFHIVIYILKAKHGFLIFHST